LAGRPFGELGAEIIIIRVFRGISLNKFPTETIETKLINIDKFVKSPSVGNRA